MLPTMLTINEASEATGLTYNCLRKWLLDGTFPFYTRSGSRYLINKQKLEEFLNAPAPRK